jgi:2'-5' RNA ligase
MPNKISAERHNRVLRAATQRALDLEQRYANIIRPILVAAGEEAARNFEAKATSLTASVADAACVARIGEFAYRKMLPALVLTADAGTHSSNSTMVCLKPRLAEAKQLAVENGVEPEDLHVTLAYLGEYDGDLELIASSLRALGANHAALEGNVGGIGAFQNGGKGFPLVLLPSVPGLVELRVAVTDALVQSRIDYGRNYGYIAHTTLSYVDELTFPPSDALGAPLHFDEILIVRGDIESLSIPLEGPTPITAAAAVETVETVEESSDALQSLVSLHKRAQEQLLQARLSGDPKRIEAAERAEQEAGNALTQFLQGESGQPSPDEATPAPPVAAPPVTVTPPPSIGIQPAVPQPKDILQQAADADTDRLQKIAADLLAETQKHVPKGNIVGRVAKRTGASEAEVRKVSRDGGLDVSIADAEKRAQKHEHDRKKELATKKANEGLTGPKPGPTGTWKKPAAGEVLDPAKLAETIAAKTKPLRDAIVQTTMMPTLDSVGVNFDASNPLVSQVLQQAGYQIVGIAEETRAQAMNIIDQSYQHGLSIRDTAHALRVGMGEDVSAERATTIARTELAGGVNGASLAATKIAAGATGDTYQKVWMCLAPGTRVSAAGVIAVVRKWHEGELLTFAARTPGGLAGASPTLRRFSVTPDHLVLTRTGWLPAGLLQPGDEVVGRALAQGNAGGNPDVDDVEPLVEEVFNAALVAAGMVSSPVYLDSGRAIGEKVDVIAADSGLLKDGDIAISQPLREFCLAYSDMGLDRLLRGGAGDDLGVRELTSAVTFRGSASSSEQSIGVALIAQSVGINLAAYGDTLLSDDRFDEGIGYTEQMSESLCGDATLVEFDEVIDIERRAFAGHVYDLTTLSGWLFADGVVAHNTAPGATYPRHDDYPDLDGSTAELDGLFQVGDAQLKYPGDPDGPPDETINCRCSLQYQDPDDNDRTGFPSDDSSVPSPASTADITGQTDDHPAAPPPPKTVPKDPIIGVTPYRPEDEALYKNNPLGFYNSAKAKQFEADLKSTAAKDNVILTSQKHVTGVWEGGKEPSYQLHADGRPEDVEKFAKEMRERYNQDSVGWFTPAKDLQKGEIPTDVSYTIHGVDPDAGVEAIESGKYGFDGATAFGHQITIWGKEDDLEKVDAMAKDLGGTVSARQGITNWVERPKFGETLDDSFDKISAGDTFTAEDGTVYKAGYAEHEAVVVRPGPDSTATAGDKVTLDGDTRVKPGDVPTEAADAKTESSGLGLLKAPDPATEVADAPGRAGYANYAVQNEDAAAAFTKDFRSKSFNSDENRIAAKQQIGKDLAERLKSNPDWQAGIADPSKQVAFSKLKEGDVFRLNGFYSGGRIRFNYRTSDGAVHVSFLDSKGEVTSGAVWGKDDPYVNGQVTLNPDPYRIPRSNYDDEEAVPTDDSQKAVEGLINNWAQTSADSDAWALSLQHAVQDEFGTEPESFGVLSARSRSAHEEADRIYEAKGPALRAFVRAQYDATQEWLKANNIKDMTLYRGFSAKDGITGMSRADITLQPASSFSFDYDSAKFFSYGGEGGYATLISSSVPASRILSTARTGFGCLSEKEVVVLAAKHGASDDLSIVAAARGETNLPGSAGSFWDKAAQKDDPSYVKPGKATPGKVSVGDLEKGDKFTDTDGNVFEVMGKTQGTHEVVAEVVEPASDKTAEFIPYDVGEQKVFHTTDKVNPKAVKGAAGEANLKGVTSTTAVDPTSLAKGDYFVLPDYGGEAIWKIDGPVVNEPKMVLAHVVKAGDYHKVGQTLELGGVDKAKKFTPTSVAGEAKLADLSKGDTFVDGQGTTWKVIGPSKNPDYPDDVDVEVVAVSAKNPANDAVGDVLPLPGTGDVKSVAKADAAQEKQALLNLPNGSTFKAKLGDSTWKVVGPGKLPGTVSAEIVKGAPGGFPVGHQADFDPADEVTPIKVTSAGQAKQVIPTDTPTGDVKPTDLPAGSTFKWAGASGDATWKVVGPSKTPGLIDAVVTKGEPGSLYKVGQKQGFYPTDKVQLVKLAEVKADPDLPLSLYEAPPGSTFTIPSGGASINTVVWKLLGTNNDGDLVAAVADPGKTVLYKVGQTRTFTPTDALNVKMISKGEKLTYKHYSADAKEFGVGSFLKLSPDSPVVWKVFDRTGDDIHITAATSGIDTKPATKNIGPISKKVKSGDVKVIHSGDVVYDVPLATTLPPDDASSLSPPSSDLNASEREAAPLSGDAAASALNDSSHDWATNLNSDDAHELTQYQGYGSASVNDALRSGETITKPDSITDANGNIRAGITNEQLHAYTVANDNYNLQVGLDNAISQYQTPAPIITYRGVSDPTATFGTSDLSSLSGQTFHDPGYMSTSVSADEASSFGNTQLQITVPQGENAAWMPALDPGNMYGMGNEQELLLPRGTSLQIGEVDTSGPTTIIHASVVHG